MFVDTHAHIYLDVFESEIDEVVERAREAGVMRIVMPAIDVPSIEKAIRLCERLDGLYAMAALHPSETGSATEADFQTVADLCDDEHVVAVGETGLDYYRDRTFDERQREFLRRHLRLAIDKDMPIVFHNREAFADLIRIVEEEYAGSAPPDRQRGIFHCFTGSAQEAERIVRAGFFLGIGGILTFKNSGLDRSLTDVSPEHIVLETDAPYLAPEPHRGKRNEPSYVRLIGEKLAAVKGVPIAEIARTTTENAIRLFGLE